MSAGNLKGCRMSGNKIPVPFPVLRNNSLFYNRWRNMMNRCYYHGNNRKSSYANKGITVCDRWHHYGIFVHDMYPAFLEICELHGYSRKISIERKDNDKGYTPFNCEWATTKEQSRNCSRNVWIEYNGERKVMADWAAQFNTPLYLLRQRIVRDKLTMEEIERRCLKIPDGGVTT